MKKGLLITLVASNIVLSITSCDKEIKPDEPYCIETPVNCYKGRLEIMGICRNITIGLIDGNIPAELIETS